MQPKLIKLMKTYFLVLILGAVIFIAGCTSGPQKIELSTTFFDLGDVDPDKGIITEEFFVKNVGGMPLKITSVSTSCGCTEAEVENDEIAPGEQTKLIINYDPSVHPGLVGKIERVVYIKSNDPFNEEIELELIGNSLPSKLSVGKNE